MYLGQSAKEVNIGECGGGRGGCYLPNWSLLIALGLTRNKDF